MQSITDDADGVHQKRGTMGYQNEWLLYEAGDEIDELEHRQPTEEFQFYQAVTSGDVEAVRKNCEEERFTDSEGVGVLSKNSVTNLKYHCVITTAIFISRAWMRSIPCRGYSGFTMRWCWIILRKCRKSTEVIQPQNILIYVRNIFILTLRSESQ